MQELATMQDIGFALILITICSSKVAGKSRQLQVFDVCRV